MTNEEIEIEAKKRYGNTIMNPDAIAMKIGFIDGVKIAQSELTRLKADVTGFAEWCGEGSWVKDRHGWFQNKGGKSCKSTSELYQEYLKQKQ